jgi:hypothetical protein
MKSLRRHAFHVKPINRGPCPLHAKSFTGASPIPEQVDTYHGLGDSDIYKAKVVPTVFKLHSETNVGLGTKSLAQIVVLGLLRHFFRSRRSPSPSHRHEVYGLAPQGCGRLDMCGHIFTAYQKFRCGDECDALQTHAFTTNECTHHQGHRGDQGLNDMHRTWVARHLHRWLFQKSLEKVASRRSLAFTDSWECPSAERQKLAAVERLQGALRLVHTIICPTG